MTLLPSPEAFKVDLVAACTRPGIRVRGYAKRLPSPPRPTRAARAEALREAARYFRLSEGRAIGELTYCRCCETNHRGDRKLPGMPDGSASCVFGWQNVGLNSEGDCRCCGCAP